MNNKKLTMIFVMGGILFSLLSGLYSPDVGHAIVSKEQSTRLKSSIQGLQVPFIANKGQMDERVAFSARTLDGTIFVTNGGDLVYTFARRNQAPAEDERLVIHEQLIDGQVKSIDGLSPSKTQVNYLRGNKSDTWVTDVKTYMQISLGDVYDGIELQLKAYGNNVEKLFYVAPGATPEHIRLKISGADSLEVNDQGQLVLVTEHGSVAFTKPIAWQEFDGSRVPVPVEYKLLGSAGQQNSYSFAIDSYDSTRTLIIDPLLASTVFGSAGDDIGHSIGVDSLGNVYVTGETSSTSFPVDINDTDYNGGDTDVFVSKFSADLTTLLASTYIGGINKDVGYALAVDSVDNIYITGATASPDYPAVNSYDTDFNNPGHGFTEVFVTKLPSDLSTLTASTFIGGGNSDEGYGLVISSGDIYVTGYTNSFDFPTTPGAYDITFDDQEDIFICRLPDSLSTITASTFLGGLGNDYGNGLTTDSQGNIFVTGSTNYDFPSTTGMGTVVGNGKQVLVAKFPSDLSALTAASVIGGGGIIDSGRAIAVDSSDNIYITGETNSPDFPTTEGAYDRVSASFEAFVTRFNNDLDVIMASTFLGGGGWDEGKALVLDDSDNVYVTGDTITEDFPTTALAYDTVHNGWDDVFLTKLSPDLSTILASTFLGSNGNDWADGLIRDGAGNLYVTGSTSENSQHNPFPVTSGSYGSGTRIGKEVFISRLDAGLGGVSVQFDAASYSANEYELSATVTLTRSGDSSGAVSVDYVTGDGSATVDSDYSAVSGTINWGDGDAASKTFTVPILQDTDVEGGETVVLTLSNPVGILLGSPHTASLNIIDDEDPGTLQFISESLSVSENGTAATITVSRTEGSDGAVSIDYATGDGTAIAGVDYTGKTGTLYWTDGEVADKSFTVDVTNNSVLDGERFLYLSLDSPTGAARIGSVAAAVLIIVDDEDAGSLQFSLESYPVAEDVGQALVTVTRSGGTTGAVSVEYFTLDDTAFDGSDYSEKVGTLNWNDGDSADKTFLVTILDDADIEGEEKVTLTLHNQTGYASLGVPNVANISITDDDGPLVYDTLQFSMSDYSVLENATLATITVTRENASDQPVSVYYATSNGTALSGVDYGATSGTLNWTGNDSAAKTFTIAIVDDAVSEESETIGLTLSVPTGGALLGARDSASLSIIDDDAAPAEHGSFEFDVPVYEAWENDGSFDVTVFRVNGSEGAVTVDFATSDNTAEVGGDYDESSGTLAWADGESDYKTFTVPLIDDTEWEGDELVNLTLSSPTGGAVLGTRPTATLKILENDAPPVEHGTLQFSASEYAVVETAAEITITVTRTEGNSGSVQVDFATGDESAVVGGDYDEMSGSLEWEDGDETDKTFVVSILDDEEQEGDETVSLTLSNPGSGAVLGTRSSATLTIHDNEVSLTEAVLILQTLVSEEVDSISLGADVTGDGRLGIEDVIYILNDQTP